MLPDSLLLWAFGQKTERVQAWREKVTLFILILATTAAYLAYLTVLPALLCPTHNDVVEILDISAFNANGQASTHNVSVAIIQGRVYKMDDLDCGWNYAMGLARQSMASGIPDVTDVLYSAIESQHQQIDARTAKIRRYLPPKKCFIGVAGWSTRDINAVQSVDNARHRLFQFGGSIYNASRISHDIAFASAIFGVFPLLDRTQEIEAVLRNRGYAMSDIDQEALERGFVGSVIQYNKDGCAVAHWLLTGSSMVLVVIFLFKLFSAMQFGTVKDPEFMHKGTVVFVACSRSWQ
jgi:hypothetical protein